MIKNYLYQYWHKYIESVDPFSLHLKQTIKVCLAGCISALVSIFILHLPSNQITWVLLPSIFVMQMYRGNSLRQRLLTQIIGGIATAALAFVNAYLGNIFIGYLALMTIASFAAFLFSQYGTNIFLPALLSLIIILFSGGMPCSNIHDALLRASFILAGTIWSIIVAHTLWPFKPTKFIRKNLERSFKILANYLEFVTNSALCGNFHRLQQYEYKNRVISHLQTCRNLVDQQPTIQNQNLLFYQLRLFAQITALSDLLSKPGSEYTLDKIESLSPDFASLSSNIALICECAASSIKHDSLQKIKHHITNMQNFLNESNQKSACLYDITIINYILKKMYDTLFDIAKTKF